jgi:hypothetical protein
MACEAQISISTLRPHHQPQCLTTTPADDAVASWSRDGKSIYFASDRSGEWQVWKMPAEGGNAVPLTRRGGYVAFESPDGHSLYYSKNGIFLCPAVAEPSPYDSSVFEPAPSRLSRRLREVPTSACPSPLTGDTSCIPMPTSKAAN